MTHPQDPEGDLRERFPGWEIWQTPGGRWCAFQKITQPQLHAGCTGALNADDVESLAAKLTEQTALRAAVTP